MSATPVNTNQNFERRYRAAKGAVGFAFTATLAFVAIAFFVNRSPDSAPDPTFLFALWIAMIVFAIGVVVYRRGKFSPMRLQTVADARGLDGLLASLQHTTVITALICLGISIMGFVITMLNGDLYPVWGAGVVRGAFISALLLFGIYPRRAAWQSLVETMRPSTQGTTSTEGGAL